MEKALLTGMSVTPTMPSVATVKGVGAVVRAARKSAGLSQTELQDKTARAVSLDTISRIERGENGTLESLQSIAEALGYEDVVAMIRAAVVGTQPLDRDGMKIVQLLPALSPRQRKRLRDSARAMLDADEE